MTLNLSVLFAWWISKESLAPHDIITDKLYAGLGHMTSHDHNFTSVQVWGQMDDLRLTSIDYKLTSAQWVRSNEVNVH